jgi:PTS system galactitol-specific IIA component
VGTGRGAGGDRVVSEVAATTAIAVEPELVRLDVEAATAADAIRAVGAAMVAGGYVEDRYVAAAVDREATFPTGLPTLPEAIALPHADPVGVLRPAIAVERLRHPVEFVEMATEGHRLPVRLVLLLALQSKDQAAVLGALVRGFQDGQLLGRLTSSSSATEIADAIRGVVGGA